MALGPWRGFFLCGNRPLDAESVFPPLHWMKDKLFCPTLILVSQLKRELLCVEAQITKGRQFKF